jgi:predicted phage terminase large subunit-like protein
VPHSPWPKQAAFCSDLADWSFREGFYGGAAGPGKSDALLMSALKYVEHPHYSALLVRETYAMLDQPGGLIFRAHEWLDPTDATWNGSRHMWTFPSGATLTFRHLGGARAERNFQGAEFHFVGIDEVTDFTLSAYRWLFSRLRRRADSVLPNRMRCASNPIGPGRDWVKARFVDKRAPGRFFLPGLLEDNPALDQADYDRSLRLLGSIRYQQLRYGNWDIKPEGRMFKRHWWKIIDPWDVPDRLELVRRWDMAGTETPKKPAARKADDPDWTVGLLLGRDREGLLYVLDVERFREGAAVKERRIREIAEADREKHGRFKVRMEQEPGSSGKDLVSVYRRTILHGFDFRGEPSTGSKETRAQPIAARAEAGDVHLVIGPWVEDFVDELAEFPEGLHDDQVDALSGAYDDLAGKQRYMGGAPADLERSEPSMLDE